MVVPQQLPQWPCRICRGPLGRWSGPFCRVQDSRGGATVTAGLGRPTTRSPVRPRRCRDGLGTGLACCDQDISCQRNIRGECRRCVALENDEAVTRGSVGVRVRVARLAELRNAVGGSWWARGRGGAGSRLRSRGDGLEPVPARMVNHSTCPKPGCLGSVRRRPNRKAVGQ